MDLMRAHGVDINVQHGVTWTAKTYRKIDIPKNIIQVFDSFKQVNIQELHVSGDECFLAGRAAALIAAGIHSNDLQLLENYEDIISDYDFYLPEKPPPRPFSLFMASNGYCIDKHWRNHTKPLQAIYKIPAAEILIPAQQVLRTEFPNLSYESLNSANLIDKSIMAYSDNPPTPRQSKILFNYDLNASQASITVGEDNLEIFASNEFYEFLSSNTLAFTERQLAWFDLFLSATDSRIFNVSTASKKTFAACQKLAGHLVIVAGRFMKYAETFPGIEESDSVSFDICSEMFRRIVETNLLEICSPSTHRNIPVGSGTEPGSIQTINPALLEYFELPTTRAEILAL